MRHVFVYALARFLLFDAYALARFLPVDLPSVHGLLELDDLKHEQAIDVFTGLQESANNAGGIALDQRAYELMLLRCLYEWTEWYEVLENRSAAPAVDGGTYLRRGPSESIDHTAKRAGAKPTGAKSANLGVGHTERRC